MERVYIETTIPSLYFDQRRDAKTVARREWTQYWWDRHHQEFELVTGVPVIDELMRGEHLRKAEKLRFLENVKILKMIGDDDET